LIILSKSMCCSGLVSDAVTQPLAKEVSGSAMTALLLAGCRHSADRGVE
jgi:hypothetical protein